MQNKIIIVEGIDGAGKSEVGKRLAYSMNAVYIDSPTSEFRNIRQYVEENTPALGKFFFYLATNFDLSHKLADLKETKNVVCSRYYYSSIADQASRERKTVEQLMEKYSIHDDYFFQPDEVILLVVDYKEQKRRLTQRSEVVPAGLDDELVLNDLTFRRRFLDAYLEMASKRNWRIIDTTPLNIDEVVNQALKEIGYNPRK